MARTVGSAADETRQRILDVAVDLFIEKGYAGTSVRDISERLGMTKGSLYYHFASKEDVLNALVQPLMDDLDAFVESASGPGVAPVSEPGAAVVSVVGSGMASASGSGSGSAVGSASDSAGGSAPRPAAGSAPRPASGSAAGSASRPASGLSQGARDERALVERLVNLLDQHGVLLRSLMGDPSVLRGLVIKRAMPARIVGVQRALSGSSEPADLLRGRLALGVIHAGAVAPRWDAVAADGSWERVQVLRARLSEVDKRAVIDAALAVLAAVPNSGS